MPKPFMPIAALAVALTLGTSLPASAQEQPDLSQVVASVNGVDITLGHVAMAQRTLPEQYQNLPPEVLFPGIVDQLIRQTLLAESLEGDWPQRIVLALDNESRSLRAGEVVEEIMTGVVTEDSLQAAYRELYLDEELGLEYNAAHILVETQETAEEIKSELDEGADFAATAREKSTGPSGPRGGDLGWFATGMMVPEFEAAVLTLNPGDVSDPVETQFGWHVIKLNEVRSKDAPPIEDVQQELVNKVRSDAVEARLQALESAGDVDKSGAQSIDPNILNQIDLTQAK